MEREYALAPVSTEWSLGMRALLGRQVRVVLDRDPYIEVLGELRWFDEDGEVCLLSDDGSYRWCWPNLECAPLEAVDGA